MSLEKNEKLSDQLKLDNASMIGWETQSVKTLPGFVKARHQVPKSIDNYHGNWIKKISEELVVAHIDEVASFLLKETEYKRKDVQIHRPDEGQAVLITREFDYSIQITQSKDQADWYLLTRKIFNFKNLEIIQKEAINDVFNMCFQELRFEIAQPFPIGEIIDRIEDEENELSEGMEVDYKISDLSTCQIQIDGFEGELNCTPSYFSIRLSGETSPGDLNEKALLVLNKLAQAGIETVLDKV